MDTPTAADIRAWTPPLAQERFAEYGYPDGDPDPLERPVREAIGSFFGVTGLALANVPVEQEALVERAIAAMTFQIAFQSTPDYLETLGDFDLIQSFSAGSYNETRRSPDEAMKARLVNMWPWLSGLLWGLMTPDKFDWWVAFFGGKNAPATQITEIDWANDGIAPGVLPEWAWGDGW